MPIFVDTSALFALLDADDLYHSRAESIWTRLADARERLLTSNYVIVETVALAARRLGFQAVRDFHGGIVPVLSVHWVDEVIHERAAAALLTAGARNLSLVDCVSFEIMRRAEIMTAFAFDDHFMRQGFLTVAVDEPRESAEGPSSG